MVHPLQLQQQQLWYPSHHNLKMTTEFLLPSAQVRVDSSVECQLPPLMSILWYPQEDWAVVTLSAEEVTWRIV